MRYEPVIMIVMTALGAAGCASTPCDKPGDYSDARPVAPLEVPEGLDPPQNTRAMAVPDAPDSVHPDLRGLMVAGPDGELRCIIEPPPLAAERRRDRG